MIIKLYQRKADKIQRSVKKIILIVPNYFEQMQFLLFAEKKRFAYCLLLLPHAKWILTKNSHAHMCALSRRKQQFDKNVYEFYLRLTFRCHSE